jgi:tetratricopeptide (TPR) repeat protein
MACGRTIRTFGLRRLSYLWRSKLAAAGLALVVLAAIAPAPADPLKTVVNVRVKDGYARLVFGAKDYLDAVTRIAGNVLIITFKQPVDIDVDRMAAQAPDYISAARRDPDGKAIRLALARQVKVNTLTAGEWLFVDLLPDTWTGLPPGLPQDIVDDLARRARAAEEQVRKDHQIAQTKKLAPIVVHVASQPTFTRYVFAVSDQTEVTPERDKNRLILNFDAPLTFDLGDAQAALPHEVESISSEAEDQTALVRFILKVNVEVRTFRDEKGFVVDLVTSKPKPVDLSEISGGAKASAAPPAIPAAKPSVEGEGGPADAPIAKSELPKSELPKSEPQKNDPPKSETPAAVAVQPPQPPQPTPPAVPPVAPNNVAPDNAAPTPAPAPTAAAPVPAVPAVAAPPAAAAAGEADAPPPAPRRAGEPGKVVVELVRQGANLKLSFPFATPVAAAVFHRADMLWLVFDAKTTIALGALDGEASRTIRGYDFTQTADAAIVRIKLDRPHLSSVAADGPVWTVEIGDSVLAPTRALDLTRNLIGPNRSSITIPFEEPQHAHRLADPEAGDTLVVVTAFAPARGFIHEQDFIEFHALASTQGVVIEPLADDVNVDVVPDKVVVGRPTGLTLSTSLQTLLRGSGLRPVMFDSQIWGFDRQASYTERQSHLLAAAAAAPDNKRLAPRLDLARFYLARDMYPEAKGVLDVALADDHATAESVSATVLRAMAEVMMNRPQEALKDLADPTIGDQHDAPLWRSLAYAREGKWSQARGGFKTVEAAVATLPIELQRVALRDEMRSAIEIGDFAGASTELNDFETIGVPHDMEPMMAVLMGRLAEGMGHTEDALAAYRTAADSWDRPAAAQGRLRETVLRYQLGDLKRADVISDLESLTTIWRGDETEIESLKVLAHLYTEDGRYRDAFYVMRSAMAAHPDSEMTRQIQDEAAQTFDTLFLAGRGDSMPAIDALALFYDFRELTPIGRRGDEMIRRLADRLASVDLLDQAADLLQYQVDHRLQGAARAQVATRLAVIYLMNRKPDRALAILRSSRSSDLSNELRNQRLLLEARALSDLGRHPLALEVIGNLDGREAIRLRSDILWAARRWAESAEQIELMYGDRYKDFQPLSDIERQDILRAEIGYALGEDALGLGRFREKYAAKMAATPDARAFDIVSAPFGTGGAEFGAIAHAAASVDTLEGFLREMRARYPDATTTSPDEPQPPAGAPAVSAQPPETQPAAPSLAPSLPPRPPARAPGRTASR